jgi:hypothetical protein
MKLEKNAVYCYKLNINRKQKICGNNSQGLGRFVRDRHTGTKRVPQSYPRRRLHSVTTWNKNNASSRFKWSPSVKYLPCFQPRVDQVGVRRCDFNCTERLQLIHVLLKTSLRCYNVSVLLLEAVDGGNIRQFGELVQFFSPFEWYPQFKAIKLNCIKHEAHRNISKSDSYLQENILLLCYKAASNNDVEENHPPYSWNKMEYTGNNSVFLNSKLNEHSPLH